MYSLEREGLKGVDLWKGACSKLKKELENNKNVGEIFIFILSLIFERWPKKEKVCDKMTKLLSRSRHKKAPWERQNQDLKNRRDQEKVNLVLKSCVCSKSKSTTTKIKVVITLKKMSLDLWKWASILIKSTKPSFLPLHPFI